MWWLVWLSMSLALLLIGLSELTDTPARAGLLLGGGVLALAAFVRRIMTASAPLIDLAVLAYPRFALASVLAVIYGELLFGQMPTLSSLTGIVLVVVAGLSLTLPMLITYLRSR